MSDGKRPSFQFYPDDHLADASLRACSVAARGVWWDMVCYMHQGHPYGHLTIRGRVTTGEQLARMTGGDPEVTLQCLKELEEAGVFSRDENGVIFCRRMVRDEAARLLRSSCGKAGGSAALGENYNQPGYVYAMLRHSDGAVKIGASTQPKQRIYRVRKQFPGDEITLLAKRSVDDMGAEEARLHAMFSGRGNGEWFDLTGTEMAELTRSNLWGDQQGDQVGDDGVTLGVVTKQSLPPSSSYSSSSSNKEIREESGGHSHHGHPVGDSMPGDAVFLTGYSKAFEAWFSVYPRRAKKQSAWTEYQAIVSYLVGSRGMTDQQAQAWLLEVAKEYADSPVGRTGGEFRPYPDTWLKDHRFDDDRSEWQHASSADKSTSKPTQPKIAPLNDNPQRRAVQ